jgi:hypothetical protein
MPDYPIIDTSLDFTTRYYILESVDEILDIFGENCIIRGCEIVNLNYNQETQRLTFDVTSGKVISDKKLIQFPEVIPMETDLSNLPDIGKLVVTVSYRYLRTSRPNLAIICIKFIDNNNICENWWLELDKLLLTVIEYDKLNNTFEKYESNYLQEKKININNIEYVSRNFDNITSNLRDFYSGLFIELEINRVHPFFNTNNI